nr:MAG TPA: hypothetical protein [Caudoviricetes sp.]
MVITSQGEISKFSLSSTKNPKFYLRIFLFFLIK